MLEGPPRISSNPTCCAGPTQVTGPELLFTQAISQVMPAVSSLESETMSLFRSNNRPAFCLL